VSVCTNVNYIDTDTSTWAKILSKLMRMDESNNDTDRENILFWLELGVMINGK
jgi:hypothetical protein